MISVLPDYHIHTTLCNHASGRMEEYIGRAIEIGLTEIGFAEHMPVMSEPHLCMTWNDLPFYVDRVKRLQDQFSGQIAIRLGAEMDMDLSRTQEIISIIDRYPFDYIIGSVHYLDGWPFDQEQYRHRFEEEDRTELYDRFFECVIQAAQSGLYDIAGHIDNLKRMGYHQPEGMDGTIHTLAGVFRNRNLAVELNTSGWDYPSGEAYPSPHILEILHEYGVPVTVGSDSHRPEHVGRHFQRAEKVLMDAGYDSVAFFSGRRRMLAPLNVSSHLTENKKK
jgi:histidinol-phosphatase (PHP family)